MEGLVLIFVEVFAALAVGLAAVVLGVVSLVLEAIAVVFGVSIQFALKDRLEPATQRFIRWTTLMLGGLAAASCVALGVVNVFFLEEVVRSGAAGLEERGVNLTIGGVEGNLFTGQLALSDVRIVREDPSSMRLELERAGVNLNWTASAFHWPTVVFSEAKVRGLTGSVEHTVRISRIVNARSGAS